MKCPWRPVTVTLRSGKATRTDFAECYYEECPFYSTESMISPKLTKCESCNRAFLELKKMEAKK